MLSLAGMDLPGRYNPPTYDTISHSIASIHPLARPQDKVESDYSNKRAPLVNFFRMHDSNDGNLSVHLAGTGWSPFQDERSWEWQV